MFVKACFGLCIAMFACPIRADLPPVFDTMSNALCTRHIELFANNSQNNTLWAYRMWDASARLSLSLTEGSQYQLGNFDECISIREPFSTQYCLATITIDIQVNRSVQDPFSLEYRPYMNLYEKLDYTGDKNQIPRNIIYWGLCVPASCEPKYIQEELQLYLNKVRTSYIKQFNVQINHGDCQIEQTGYSYTPADYLFCCMIVFFLMIVGVCTAYNVKYVYENDGDVKRRSKAIDLLLCFSAKKNYIELTKPESTKNEFKLIYGLKIILMLSIILGHSFANMMTGSILNFNSIEQNTRSLPAMIYARGELVVEVFFFISALLNTYSFLIQSQKKTFNPLRSIIIRYFRLVPAYAIIVFFYTTLFYKIGSGPMWPKIVGAESNYCKENWWINLLMLNNYVNSDNACMKQSWYLAADFQLFLLSIPLNYLILKNNMLSWSIFSSFLFGSILIPFLIVYIGKKDPIMYMFNNFFTTLRTSDYFQSVYVPTHARMSSYFLGMLMGLFYYKHKDRNLKISLISSIAALLAAVIIFCVCIFSAVIFYNPYLPYDALTAAFYASLHRPAYAIASGILVFVLNHGSIPNILCWRPLIPLAKLSFNAYLLHFIFQLSKVGTQRSPLTFTVYYWICQAIIEVVLSLFAAFILFIFIENPSYRFVKEIIPKNFCKRKSIKNKTADDL